MSISINQYFQENKAYYWTNGQHIKKTLVNEEIEESFDIMKDVVSISSAARMKGKLKRRWPLNEAQICVKKGQKIKLEITIRIITISTKCRKIYNY